MKNAIYALIIISFLFSLSCRKNNSKSSTQPPNNSKFFTEETIENITGIVMDIDSNIIANAEVTIGANTTKTDANGLFTFSKINTSKNATSIQVWKDGFMKGYRTISIASNSDNYTIIRLWKRPVPTIFDATKDFNISTADYQLHISANSLQLKNSGTSYSGNVKVYVVPMLANNINIYYTMPGGIIAKNIGGEPTILKTFGMLDVELFDVNDNPLQIKEGSTADFSIDIPASELSKAPPIIPMWYINENTGIWQEEGTAFKQGNKYKGIVKHFTPWNFDLGFGISNFNIRKIYLKDSLTSSPAYNYRIDLIDTAGILQSYYTNIGGFANYTFIAQGTYTANIYDPCNSFLYSTTFVQNSSFAEPYFITIPIQYSNVVQISGVFVDCNNNPVNSNTNLYITNVCSNGTSMPIQLDTNGAFIFYVSKCFAGSTYTIQVYDYSNRKKGLFLGTIPIANYPIGNIQLCTPIDYSYISCYYNNVMVHLESAYEGGFEFKSQFLSNNNLELTIGELYDLQHSNGLGFKIDTNNINGQRLISEISLWQAENSGQDWGYSLTIDSNLIPLQLVQNNFNSGGALEFSFHSKLLYNNYISHFGPNKYVDSVDGYFIKHY